VRLRAVRRRATRSLLWEWAGSAARRAEKCGVGAEGEGAAPAGGGSSSTKHAQQQPAAAASSKGEAKSARRCGAPDGVVCAERMMEKASRRQRPPCSADGEQQHQRRPRLSCLLRCRCRCCRAASPERCGSAARGAPPVSHPGRCRCERLRSTQRRARRRAFVLWGWAHPCCAALHLCGAGTARLQLRHAASRSQAWCGSAAARGRSAEGRRAPRRQQQSKRSIAAARPPTPLPPAQTTAAGQDAAAPGTCQARPQHASDARRRHPPPVRKGRLEVLSLPLVRQHQHRSAVASASP
jgi:hypothetical protein